MGKGLDLYALQNLFGFPERDYPHFPVHRNSGKMRYKMK